MKEDFMDILDAFSVDESTKEEKSKQESKIDLTLNGAKIHSLKELRENFNAQEVVEAHNKGILHSWLKQHYYENEADEIKSISLTNPHCLRKLCVALGVDYIDVEGISEEEKEKLKSRRKLISETVSDKTILSEIWLVATNQEELAELLSEREKRIYLYKESFSIPISVPNTEYIGIGNPELENPYTYEQYIRAGIKISGFKLPKEVDKSSEKRARKAAKANGYDDFYEYHTPLATKLHEALKSCKYDNMYYLNWDSELVSEFYNSKSACISARDKSIKKAYAEAEKYLSNGNKKSISQEASQFYSQRITKAFEGILDGIYSLSCINNADKSYEKLKNKVENSHKNLLQKFEDEISDNKDYYAMESLKYFIDFVEIEEHDFRVSDDLFFSTIERFLPESIQYTAFNIVDVINDMSEGLCSRANAFFEEAYRIYEECVSEIESLLDKIGLGLPNFYEKENIQDYISRCTLMEAM